MDRSVTLMLHGTLGWCPDCAGEQLLLPTDDGDHCCTACDAAVFVLDAAVRRGGPGVDRVRLAG